MTYILQIAQPQIEALKSWAVRSGARSASFEYSEIHQPELRMLEVDCNASEDKP
jgi:hypothetical protein